MPTDTVSAPAALSPPVRRPAVRLSNVPLPEPHVAGLRAGGAAHLAAPWPLPGPRWAWLPAGALLLLAGVAVVGWAVIAHGTDDAAAPSSLTTAGPYRHSRNPMYVGWTAGYLGATVLAGSAWPLLPLPAVLLLVHRAVRREERALERRFGDAYRAYRRAVPRYR